MWDTIVDALKRAFTWMKNVVRRIIRGIMNFMRDIVNWFRNLPLLRGRDIPVVFNTKNKQVRDMIANARVVDVGLMEDKGVVITGVFNNETDEITHMEVLEADDLDYSTKTALGNDPLIVLN